MSSEASKNNWENWWEEEKLLEGALSLVAERRKQGCSEGNQACLVAPDVRGTASQRGDPDRVAGHLVAIDNKGALGRYAVEEEQAAQGQQQAPGRHGCRDRVTGE